MDSTEFYSINRLNMMSNSVEAFPAFSTSSPTSQYRLSGPDPENQTTDGQTISASSPCVLHIDPVAVRSATFSFVAPCIPPKSRRKPKQSAADSCIRRLCASHQNDIGLLCDLWSSPSNPQTPPHCPPPSEISPKISPLTPPPTPVEPVILHTACSENERQRLLQVEMQLMRMQLQQAELLLSSRSSSSPLVGLSRNPSLAAQEEPKTASPYAVAIDLNECARKPQLRLPLDEDPTLSVQIAQEEHQNLLWAEADYRAYKRGSKPASPTNESPDHSSKPTNESPDHSDANSVSPSGGEFTHTPLYQGYLKMPRGRFCKFWCSKKRFCMLDSARCFFYWKSQEQRESGRAKCFSGVTRGTLLPGDDKSIELTYAGGACVVVLKSDSAADAQRWLVALASLDDSSNERQMQDAEKLVDHGTSTSHPSSVITSESSPDVLRRTLAQANCAMRREVIQNAFLDEFRKERQFEQLLRSSKNSMTPSPCAREGVSSLFV
jgi:hypothetical protein